MSAAAVTFVGLGFREGDVTIAGLAALRRATKVYYYHESSGPPWLKRLFPEAVDIFSVTEGNSNDRRHRYEDTIGFLLGHACCTGHVVACAFYGSAAFTACIPHMALQRGRERGISVRILPGVSCFESLLCDLAGHPVAGKWVNIKGITIVTASEFLQAPHRFSPLMPLVITVASHVGAFGDAENRRGLEHLAAVLARQYDPYFEIVLYSAKDVPIIRTVPICKLPEVPMPLECAGAL